MLMKAKKISNCIYFFELVSKNGYTQTDFENLLKDINDSALQGENENTLSLSMFEKRDQTPIASEFSSVDDLPPNLVNLLSTLKSNMYFISDKIDDAYNNGSYNFETDTDKILLKLHNVDLEKTIMVLKSLIIHRIDILKTRTRHTVFFFKKKHNVRKMTISKKEYIL